MRLTKLISLIFLLCANSYGFDMLTINSKDGKVGKYYCAVFENFGLSFVAMNPIKSDNDFARVRSMAFAKDEKSINSDNIMYFKVSKNDGIITAKGYSLKTNILKKTMKSDAQGRLAYSAVYSDDDTKTQICTYNYNSKDNKLLATVDCDDNTTRIHNYLIKNRNTPEYNLKNVKYYKGNIMISESVFDDNGTVTDYSISKEVIKRGKYWAGESDFCTPYMNQ